MMDLPFDLKFHFAFQHDDQFVRRVCEVLLPLPGSVGPQLATESALLPACSHLGSFDHCLEVPSLLALHP